MPVNGYGPEKPDEKIYIREAAEALNRKMGTLRKWDQSGILPSDLVPQRGSRGWRYWTEEQVEGLQEWLRDTDRRPGKALPHYNPTEVQLDKAIRAMRGERPRSTGSVPSTSGGVVDL